ncbi:MULTISPECIES: hypothetical protein [Streptomyces]|uniref:Uncharacterized protein n=1 Tax=Streptomyces sviceus (strain ATCC 29083 / DSM 924 / JCM 4929 / NBRC 13980 / NCIMB 11184 / NRRL 5439 / UC 5370) TaxID=463191 RepID=B5HT94_STRX2|nr:MULTISPECIES: hypothetical protein [Streptomyces]EDY56049.1 conserved hypothetical protein [Streptomyces sviceus ATCC 29083]MYT09020.1 hypothetical protein [Streptomyces sp. SID5470]
MNGGTDLGLTGGRTDGWLLLSGLSADGRSELYKFVDLKRGRLHEVSLGIEEQRESQLAFLRRHLRGEPPYGLDRVEDLLPYLLHPHSFLETASKDLVVSFKQAPYLRILSAAEGHPVWSPDPPGDVVGTLSSTNCEAAPDTIAFTSTDTADRLRRYDVPDHPLRTRLMTYDRVTGAVESRGELPDFLIDTLHQLVHSPDGYFVGVDMNLSVLPGPDGVPGASREGVDVAAYTAGSFPRSAFFVADEHLKHLTVRTPSRACAAHAEIDPHDPEVFYVSCNNISKWRNQVVLHGPGTIERYRYRDGAVTLEGSYSDPEFLRITSQRCFQREQRRLLAVTGYPNKLYILDAETLELVDRIVLFEEEHREPPYVCEKNSSAPLYLAVSSDGRYVFMTGAAELFVVDLEARAVVDRVRFCPPGSFAATAHIGLVSDQAAHRALENHR